MLWCCYCCVFDVEGCGRLFVLICVGLLGLGFVS